MWHQPLVPSLTWQMGAFTILSSKDCAGRTEGPCPSSIHNRTPARDMGVLALAACNSGLGIAQHATSTTTPQTLVRVQGTQHDPAGMSSRRPANPKSETCRLRVWPRSFAFFPGKGTRAIQAAKEKEWARTIRAQVIYRRAMVKGNARRLDPPLSIDFLASSHDDCGFACLSVHYPHVQSSRVPNPCSTSLRY